MTERRLNTDDVQRKERVKRYDAELMKRLVKPHEIGGLTVAFAMESQVDCHYECVIRFTDGRFLAIQFHTGNELEDVSSIVNYSEAIPDKRLMYDVGLIDRAQYLDRLTKAERATLDRLEASERAELARLKAKYEVDPEPCTNS